MWQSRLEDRLNTDVDMCDYWVGILFWSSISTDDWPATTRGVWQHVGKNFVRSAACFCQHGGVKERLRLKTDGEPVVNVLHCFCAAPEKEALLLSLLYRSTGINSILSCPVKMNAKLNTGRMERGRGVA